MLNCISQRINKDAVFQASEKKNPLKVMLSEGYIFKTLTSLASCLVGTRGFEPRTPTVSGQCSPPELRAYINRFAYQFEKALSSFLARILRTLVWPFSVYGSLPHHLEPISHVVQTGSNGEQSGHIIQVQVNGSRQRKVASRKDSYHGSKLKARIDLAYNGWFDNSDTNGYWKYYFTNNEI